jgi:uncharacterized Tic20 family protein
MFRYLAWLIGFFVIIAVLPARGQAPVQQAPIQTQAPVQEGLLTQTQNPAEARPSGQIQSQAQSLTAQTLESQTREKLRNSRIVGLVGGIVGGILLLALIGSLIAWQWRKTPQAKDDERALEELRIIYGFWLIVSVLLIALLVFVVTLAVIPPDTTTKASDIVAIAGTVTGLITTLTAAFFGIQQAGAGRSQALTTLTLNPAVGLRISAAS